MNTQQERLTAEIAGLQEQWDLYTERLSRLRKRAAISTDVAEKLKIEHEIAEVVEARKATSQQIRELEEQRDLLPSLTDVSADTLEFVNRSQELRYITKLYCPPYLLISAPAGYGKSRLLENINTLLPPSRCLIIPLRLSRNTPVSIQRLLHDIAQQLGMQFPEQWNTDTVQRAGYTVGRSLLQVLNPSQRQIVFLIDEAEAFGEAAIKDMLEHFIPALKEGLSITDSPIGLRFIWAGRYLSYWKQWDAKLPLELLPLTSFNFAAVRETVENFASTRNFRTSTQYRQDFAAYLMHFTGGHPGCMIALLKRDYGAPISLIADTEDDYYHNIMKSIIQEVRSPINPALQPIFERLSITRLYNYPLLQKIIEDKLISYTGTAVKLGAALSSTYLVERKNGFIQDDIIRRLFAIALRKEHLSTFLDLREHILRIYAEYLQQTSYHPHAIALEALYQELQLAYYKAPPNLEEDITLHARFFKQDGILQYYLNLLAAKKDRQDILANFLTTLQDKTDWEFQFTLNFFLRQDEHYSDAPYQTMIAHVKRFMSALSHQA